MRHHLFAAVAASLAIAGPAAATVRYDFLIPSGELSFSLTRADFVSGPLFVDVSDLDSCFGIVSGSPAPCLGVDFNPDFFGVDSLGLLYRTSPISTIESFFWFPLGAFGRAGVYRAMDSEGELRVTNFKDGGVPEPAAWALMILGFGLAGGALRRGGLRHAS